MRVLPFHCRGKSCPCYYCSLTALLPFPLTPINQPSTERTDHPVRLFTLSSTCITPTMDSLWTKRSYHSSGMSARFFQSLHHLHLSTLQPFSLPAKIVCLENCPYRDASRNVSQQGFSSRWREACAHSCACIFNLKLDPKLLSCTVTS